VCGVRLHLLPTTLVTPHLDHRVTLPLSSLSACLFVFSPGPHFLQCAASRQPRHDCTSTPSPKSWANCHDAETLGAEFFFRQSEQVRHAMPFITLKPPFQKTMEKLLSLTRTVNLTSLSMNLSLLLPALTKMVLPALCSVIMLILCFWIWAATRTQTSLKCNVPVFVASRSWLDAALSTPRPNLLERSMNFS